MKKLITILALTALLMLSGCGEKPQPGQPADPPSGGIAAEDVQANDPSGEAQGGDQDSDAAEQTRAAYSDLYSLYRQALEERWDGNKLTEKGMSLMLLDCYGAAPLENIGYAYADFDGNGKEEFVVALTDAFTDDYYGKLVLDLYSINDNGEAVQVLSSWDRNRYYYAGGDRFANVGSGGVSMEVNTTLRLQGVELIDMTTVTEPADYQQIKTELFG